jgi:hypothetical protein
MRRSAISARRASVTSVNSSATLLLPAAPTRVAQTSY